MDILAEKQGAYVAVLRQPEQLSNLDTWRHVMFFLRYLFRWSPWPQ